MTREAVPVLLTVMTCAALAELTLRLPKVSEVVLRLATGVGGEAPVPVRFADCGLSPALSVSVMAAVFAPIVVGEKVTERVQLLPSDKLPGQGLVRLNCETSLPVFAIEEIVRVAEPDEVTKIVWTAEVVPVA